ncbi:MAG: hypothetical protein PH343_10695, partial [Nitrospira sp.]|nr:hypothetical protein [Nitrospira sp.]
IKYLAEVISNSSALSMLEQKKDLKIAYLSLVPPGTVFRENLIKAQIAAQEALANSYGYIADKSLLEAGQRLHGASEALLEIMKNAHKKIEG